MTALLFTLAFFLAAGVLLWRKRPRKLFVEDRQPRLVVSHDEISGVINDHRCTCGGRYFCEGEGPGRHDDGDVWRVLTGCSRCERRRAFLFRIAS